MPKIKRAVTVDELTRKKFKELPLTGRWEKLIGIPQATGTWIIWADSGSGKSRLCMMMAKELAQIMKVAYDSLEEGARKTIRENVLACNMKDVKRNFLILNRESIQDLKERLRKPKHPKVVFIDSIQYSGLTKSEYIALKEEFEEKVLFIFISHADGKEPLGAVAKFIRYDADVKIRAEGFRAFAVSRYGGGTPFDIWPERAAEYWADIK